MFFAHLLPKKPYATLRPGWLTALLEPCIARRQLLDVSGAAVAGSGRRRVPSTASARMRWQWRRALLCALLLAVFVRPFGLRAYQRRHPRQPEGDGAAAAAGLRVVAAAGAPTAPELDPVALAAAQAAADAAAAEQEASSQRQQAAARAAAAEARGPPHWAPDKNNWWEEGLGLAPWSTRKRLHSRIDILVVVLSGRAAKYSSRRETIRTTWAADVTARATKQKLNLKLVFAVGDNFCGYDPTNLAASATSFPAARCKTGKEHDAGGTLSDEHTTLLTEYRKRKHKHSDSATRILERF